MKKLKMALLILVLVSLVFALASCTGANPMQGTPPESGNVAGFWSGLWDGAIAIPAFVINLISDNGGAFYDVYNNGGWYNLGFLLGICSIYGGGSGVVISTPSRRHRGKTWTDQINDEE